MTKKLSAYQHGTPEAIHKENSFKDCNLANKIGLIKWTHRMKREMFLGLSLHVAGDVKWR